MTGGGDTGSPVHVDTDVALVTENRCTGMNAHSDAYRSRNECHLSRLGGGQRVVRPIEHEEEGITLCVDLDTLVSGEGVAHEAPVFGEYLCVAIAELLQ